MIERGDILSMEYLKKTEYTGCHKGMRYRLEKKETDDGKFLLVTVWPEPFNYHTTPEEKKQRESFSFDEDGVCDAVRWLNERFLADEDVWKNAARQWDSYVFKD